MEAREKTRLNGKLVIIINGKGASGKDTLCRIAEQAYRAKTISSITPIKAIAAQHGWNGEKDSRARRFLADLKRAFVAYNDLPNRYLASEYRAFTQDADLDLLLVHIREPDQIDAFRQSVGCKCLTLLIHASKLDGQRYGNDADDRAEAYAYDHTYINDRPLSDLAPDFLTFLHALFVREGVTE